MKKIYSAISLCFIVLSLVNSQQLPSKSDVISTMKLVNDYWIENHPDPGDNNWDRATYFTGNMDFYRIYPYTRYLNYAEYWANMHNWGIRHGTNFRHADAHCIGQVYIDLYELDTTQKYKIKDITTTIRNFVDSTKNDDWDWIDALYMAMPVFARLGVIHNDTAYHNKLYEMYSSTKYDRKLYNSTTGLWYRDEKFLPTDTLTSNGKEIYWSRGNGWVIAAHVRVLQHLPVTDPHRQEYINTFKGMAAALKNVQRDDGFWNVNLGDPDDFGGKETSGTSFFTYGMAWGINNGFLDSATYYPIIAKAWQGLIDTAVHEDGKLGWVQGVGSMPASSQPVTYEKTTDFGVGAFLLAGSEVVKLAPGAMPKVPYHFIDSVKLVNRNVLEIYFNDVMKESSAEDTSNYFINDSIKIRRATLSGNGKKVTLDIGTLQNGPYTITFDSIENENGDAMEPGYREHFVFNLIVNITASGYQEGSKNYPENTVDGVLTNRWSQSGNNEWIMYELESVDTVTSLDIAFYLGNQRVGYFDIEVGTDTNSLVKIYSGQSSGTTLELENYDIPDTAARFVKIVGHGNSSNLWNSITEAVINVKLKADPELPEIIDAVNEAYVVFNEKLIAYPNPLTDNILNINTSGYKQGDINIAITDITGKQVYNNVTYIKEYEPIRLNVNLTKGMYIIVVTGEDITKNAKILVK